MTKDVFEREYFFDDGIRFGCVQCGCCCTGEPGIVKVSWGELDLIAHTLNVTAKSLLESGVVIPHQAAYRLHEDERTGSCVFFENNGCQIYSARPRQCRTWPFWFQNMRSRENWQAVAACCPGIGQGRLYTKDEILALLKG